MGATVIQDDVICGEKGDTAKRIELANTYFFKGRKSLNKGDSDEALGMFRASIAIHEEVYGTYHKRTARSYFFLAQTLFKHTNDFDRALTAYRRALRVGLSLDADHTYVEGAKRAIRELLLEKKSFDVEAVEKFFSSIIKSVRLEKEGLDYTDNKNYERSLEAFEKCFSIEEKAEGTFPLDLGHLHIRIAEVNRKQREYGMSINSYRSALSIYESALGREHADSIFCLKGIESSLYEMNLSDSANQEYMQSIFRSLNYCQKGDMYMESNHFIEAVKEYEAARSIEEKFLGRYPLTASDIRKKIGLAFRSLKEHDRTILELRAALSIYIFECGEDHQSVVHTLHEIRSVMGEKGYDFSSINKYMNTVAFSIKHERYGEHLLLEKNDFSGAIEEFQKSLTLEVSALGKYHLTQGGLFKLIGDAFLQRKIYDFAVVNYRNALLVYQPLLGVKHNFTASVLTSIGNAAFGTGLSLDKVDEYRKVVSESITIEKKAENLANEGAGNDAIATYRKAVRNEESLIGDCHLSTADLHWKIAKVLKHMGRYDSSIVSYRYILAINLKSLGKDHLNTENAHEDLVHACILKGLKNEDATGYGKNAKISIELEDNGDEAMIKQNFQSAIINYKKALAIEDRFLGDDHLVTEGVLRKIVKCQKLSGKTDQAFHFYRKMIRIYMTYEFPDYDTDSMLRSLETTIQDLGLSETQKAEYIDIVKESVKCEIEGDSAEESENYGRAIDQYSRCLLMEQSLFGMLHPSIWQVYQKIGSTFEKKGDIDFAIISHSKALAILESYLGMKEKETTETYSNLLNATLKKISCISDTLQVDSNQNRKITSSFERSVDNCKVQEKQCNERAPKEDKKGMSDIYNAFAQLRNDLSREDINDEGDKMKILKGLAQRWHELDESGSIIDIDSRGSIEGKNSTSDTGPSIFSSQRENFNRSEAINLFDKQGKKENVPGMKFRIAKSDDAANLSTEKSSVGFVAKSPLITSHVDSVHKSKSSIGRADITNRNIHSIDERDNSIIKSVSNSMKSHNIENKKAQKSHEHSEGTSLSKEHDTVADLEDVPESSGRREVTPDFNHTKSHEVEDDNADKSHARPLNICDSTEAKGMGNSSNYESKIRNLLGATSHEVIARKGQDKVSEMTISEKLESKKSKLNLSHNSSLSRNHAAGDIKNRGIGSLIESFDYEHKMDPIESDEPPQRKSTTLKEEKTADEMAKALDWIKNSNAKGVNDDNFTVDISTKPFQKIEFSISEIPPFNSNRNSKCDDSSSSSSYSSYESL